MKYFVDTFSKKPCLIKYLWMIRYFQCLMILSHNTLGFNQTFLYKNCLSSQFDYIKSCREKIYPCTCEGFLLGDKQTIFFIFFDYDDGPFPSEKVIVIVRWVCLWKDISFYLAICQIESVWPLKYCFLLADFFFCAKNESK